MIQTIYNFFWQWLFNGVQPTFLSVQGAEFITIVFTIMVFALVLWIAVLPIKALLQWIFRG